MSEGLGLEVIYGFLEAAVRYLRSTVGLDAVVAAIGEPTAPAHTIAVTLDFSGDVHGPVMSGADQTCSASEKAPPLSRTVASIHQRPLCSNSVASLATMPEISVASLTQVSGKGAAR